MIWSLGIILAKPFPSKKLLNAKQLDPTTTPGIASLSTEAVGANSIPYRKIINESATKNNKAPEKNKIMNIILNEEHDISMDASCSSSLLILGYRIVDKEFGITLSNLLAASP